MQTRGSKLFEVNMWSWRYGQAQPRSLSVELSGSSECLTQGRLEERQQETNAGWRLNFEDRRVRSRDGTRRHRQSQTVTDVSKEPNSTAVEWHGSRCLDS